MGLLYDYIVRMLAVEHGIVLTTRHLKRTLRSRGPARRNNYSEIGDVIEYVQGQIMKSSMLHGYTWMYGICLANGFRCKKEDIRQVLGIFDPIGVEQRRKRPEVDSSFILIKGTQLFMAP